MLSQALETLKEFFSRPVIFSVVTTVQIISAVVVVVLAIGIIVFKRKHHKVVHDFKPEPPEE